MALQKSDIVFTSDRAFVAVIDSRGFQLGVAIKGRHGYQRYRNSPSFDSFEDAQKEADARNEKLGLTPAEAYEIVISSMREDIPDPIEKELARG